MTCILLLFQQKLREALNFEVDCFLGKGIFMPHTSDNDKKAKDKNAMRHEKAMESMKNRQAGKKSFSKKTDHL